MGGMGEHYKKVLIRNIVARMTAKGFSSPEALAKKCYWQSGKKRGERVSARHVRYLLTDKLDAPNVAGDVVAAIAVALECDIWELYFDETSMREKLVNRLFPKSQAKAEPITTKARKIASRVD